MIKLFTDKTEHNEKKQIMTYPRGVTQYDTYRFYNISTLRDIDDRPPLYTISLFI